MKETIIDIIDNKLDYRITRRCYDEAFAKAHGILLKDIEELRFVPCLECGEDISTKVFLHKGNGMKPVYCSSLCRTKHGTRRLRKLSDSTDINAFNKELIEHCLQITTATERAVPARNNLRARALAMQTNKLLAEILEELRNGNRKT